jgi:hypothetical protein
MRPEDVTLEAAAQRSCGMTGLEPADVKHARATGEAQWEGTDTEAGWLVVHGDTRDGTKTLRMLCRGLEYDIVADVRPI